MVVLSRHQHFSIFTPAFLSRPGSIFDPLLHLRFAVPNFAYQRRHLPPTFTTFFVQPLSSTTSAQRPAARIRPSDSTLHPISQTISSCTCTCDTNPNPDIPYCARRWHRYFHLALKKKKKRFVDVAFEKQVLQRRG